MLYAPYPLIGLHFQYNQFIYFTLPVIDGTGNLYLLLRELFVMFMQPKYRDGPPQATIESVGMGPVWQEILKRFVDPIQKKIFIGFDRYVGRYLLISGCVSQRQT